MIFASVFAIAVGVLMIGQWSFFYLSNQIPELETEPYRIGFHLAGEFATAIALIVGGVGLLTGQGWASWLYMVAVGMLLYTVIVSPGYFAQRGEWPFVGMFAVLLVLAVVSIILVV
jgi:peptidoglycan/LPS O-acetylase OafA/YrhL